MAILPIAVKHRVFFFPLLVAEEDDSDVLCVSPFSYQVFHPKSRAFPNPPPL